jgi:fido (protein-threonine AMPylation protein)
VSDDPYVFPGTDVLRNMRDIRDGAELEQIES